MMGRRDMIPPGKADSAFEVIGIGLNSEGKLAMCSASGYSYNSRQEVERKREELLKRWLTPVYRFNNIVLLPMMFGSETFYSLGAAPAWVRTLSHLLPLSYLLDAARSALAGDAAGTLMPSLILLTFRWDPDVPLIRRKLRVRAA